MIEYSRGINTGSVEVYTKDVLDTTTYLLACKLNAEVEVRLFRLNACSVVCAKETMTVSLEDGYYIRLGFDILRHKRQKYSYHLVTKERLNDQWHRDYGTGSELVNTGDTFIKHQGTETMLIEVYDRIDNSGFIDPVTLKPLVGNKIGLDPRNTYVVKMEKEFYQM